MRIIENQHIHTKIKKVSKFILSLLISLIESTYITSFLLDKQYIHGFSSELLSVIYIKGGNWDFIK